jgi:membrane protein required for colicin V production
MILDIIFAIVVGYGFYLGYSKKAARTVSLLIMVVLSLLLSLSLCPFITDFLSTKIQADSKVLFFVGFVTSFLIAVFSVRWVLSWLEDVLKKDNVSMATYVSTGLVTGAFFLFLYGSGLSLFDDANGIDPKVKRQSVTYDFTTKFPESAKSSLTGVGPVVEDLWGYITNSMEENYEEAERSNRKNSPRR